MKHFWSAFLMPTVLFVSSIGILSAQFGEEVCIITIKGQNRNRTVAGAINEECGTSGFTIAPPLGTGACPRITATKRIRTSSADGSMKMVRQQKSSGTPAPQEKKNFERQTAATTTLQAARSNRPQLSSRTAGSPTGVRSLNALTRICTITHSILQAPVVRKWRDPSPRRTIT